MRISCDRGYTRAHCPLCTLQIIHSPSQHCSRCRYQRACSHAPVAQPGIAPGGAHTHQAASLQAVLTRTWPSSASLEVRLPSAVTALEISVYVRMRSAYTCKTSATCACSVELEGTAQQLLRAAL